MPKYVSTLTIIFKLLIRLLYYPSYTMCPFTLSKKLVAILQNHLRDLLNTVTNRSNKKIFFQDYSQCILWRPVFVLSLPLTLISLLPVVQDDNLLPPLTTSLPVLSITKLRFTLQNVYLIRSVTLSQVSSFKLVTTASTHYNNIIGKSRMKHIFEHFDVARENAHTGTQSTNRNSDVISTHF